MCSKNWIAWLLSVESTAYIIGTYSSSTQTVLLGLKHQLRSVLDFSTMKLGGATLSMKISTWTTMVRYQLQLWLTLSCKRRCRWNKTCHLREKVSPQTTLEWSSKRSWVLSLLAVSAETAVLNAVANFRHAMSVIEPHVNVSSLIRSYQKMFPSGTHLTNPVNRH